MKSLIWALIVSGSIRFSPAMMFVYSAQSTCSYYYDKLVWRFTCPTPDKYFKCDMCDNEVPLKEFPYYNPGTCWGDLCGYCID